MPDMTENDQEVYGRVYAVATEDILNYGIGYAERFAAHLVKHEDNPVVVFAYTTSVKAWKEGVRL